MTTVRRLTKISNDAARAITQHIEREHGITLALQTCIGVTRVIQDCMGAAAALERKSVPGRKPRKSRSLHARMNAVLARQMAGDEILK